MQLTPEGCFLFSEIVHQMASEKPKYSRQDRLEELRMAGLDKNLEAVAMKIIELVYDKPVPPTGEEFLNFCYRNQGRIRVTDRERL